MKSGHTWWNLRKILNISVFLVLVSIHIKKKSPYRTLLRTCEPRNCVEKHLQMTLVSPQTCSFAWIQPPVLVLQGNIAISHPRISYECLHEFLFITWLRVAAKWCALSSLDQAKNKKNHTKTRVKCHNLTPSDNLPWRVWAPTPFGGKLRCCFSSRVCVSTDTIISHRTPNSGDDH